MISPEIAKSHLLAWNIYSSEGIYKPFRHSALLCARLMDVLAGRKNRRLIIQMPPQHSKSLTTTEGLATYFLGSNPDKRVGICSHTGELAEDFGFRNRQRMLEYGPTVFGVEPDPHRKSRHNWSLKDHPSGGMVSVGVGGPLTGRRLDLLIVDDAIKNYEEAQSSHIRDSVWNWLVTVGLTRLSKQAPVVVIGTRWHNDDHIGRLIRQSQATDGVEYDVLSLPALAGEDEYLEDGSLFRKRGDPLCPELHPLDELLEIKKFMTPFQWSALYGQDPTTPDGCQWDPSLFNDRVMVDKWPERIQYLVLALDPSSGRDQKRGDYPAVCALATTGDGLFYCDFIMERAPPSQVAASIASYASQLRSETGITPMALGVEKLGLWEVYAERLVQEFDKVGMGVPILEVSHQSKDKTLRIQRLDPFVSNREVRFLRTKGTLVALEQFRDFPTGRHDDACDSCEMAFRIFPQVVGI